MTGVDGLSSLVVEKFDNKCCLCLFCPCSLNSAETSSTITKIHEQDTSRTTGNSSRSLTFVKAILHLPDESVRPSVRLTFIDEDDGKEMAQPSLHTNFVPLPRNANGYTVLAAACSR